MERANNGELCIEHAIYGVAHWKHAIYRYAILVGLTLKASLVQQLGGICKWSAPTTVSYA